MIVDKNGDRDMMMIERIEEILEIFEMEIVSVGLF